MKIKLYFGCNTLELLGILYRVDGKEFSYADVAGLWNEFNKTNPLYNSEFADFVSKRGWILEKDTLEEMVVY
jgi:hypothetical protein